jgi:hypothetical protein
VPGTPSQRVELEWGARLNLDSVHLDREDKNADDVLRDLSWLELQYRLRHALARAKIQPTERQDLVESDGECEKSSLSSRFGGAGLTNVVTDVEKLRRVNSRRQRYLEGRDNSETLDLLVRLRSSESTFAHIRAEELQSVSHWFPPAESDNDHKWASKFSLVTAGYGPGNSRVSNESGLDKYGLHLIEMKSPADHSRDRDRYRRRRRAE